jgi:hypothetical protein
MADRLSKTLKPLSAAFGWGRVRDVGPVVVDRGNSVISGRRQFWQRYVFYIIRDGSQRTYNVTNGHWCLSAGLNPLDRLLKNIRLAISLSHVRRKGSVVDSESEQSLTSNDGQRLSKLPCLVFRVFT